MTDEIEEQYRTLYENALVGLWTSIIRDGKFIRANDTAAKIAGYENADDLMKNCTAIKLFDYETRVEFNRELREHGVKSGFEAVLIDKDGNEKEITVSGKIDIEKGTIEGVFIDISNLKETEKALKDSEEKYSNLFQHSNDGIFLHDLDGNVIDVNQKVLDLFGYTKSDILSLKISDLHPNEDLETSRKAFDQISNKGFVRFEINFKKSNDEVFPAEVSSSIFKLGEKRVIQGIVRDITDRKQAELKLSESEKKFRTITEQSLMGIAILQDNIVKYVNEQFASLLGHSVENIKSWGPGEFIKTVHPEDRNMVIRHAELRQQGLYDDTNHYFYRSIKKSGETLWFEVYAKIILYKGRPADLVTIVDITETKEAEELLTESEEKYRNIIENTMEGYFEVDLRGNITFANDALGNWSGFSRKELIRMNYKDFMSEENSKRTLEVFNEVYKTGVTNVSFEYEFINREGKKLYGESSISLRYDSEGNKIGFSGFIRDVTEKRVAELKLMESEEKYRNIIENTREGYFEVDLKGDFTFFNDSLCELLGYTSEELMGMNYKVYMNEADVKRTFNLFNNVYRTGKAERSFQNELIRKDGKHLFGESSVYLRYDFNGTKIGFSGFLRDITEKREAEQKLRESEEKYRTFVENFQGIALQADMNFKPLFFHGKVEEITGYIEEDFISGNLSWDKMIFPEDRAKFYDKAKKLQKIPNSINKHEYRIVRKDKDIRWVNAVIQNLSDENGKPYMVNGVIYDITERKKMEQKLKESEENYRSIFNSSPDYIYLTDMSGDFLEANQVFLDRIKLPIEELRGMNFIDFYAGERLPEILGILKNLRHGEQVKGLDVRAKTPFGDVMDLEVNSVPIIEGGKVTKVISIARDDSERKLAEQKLKESEEKYRILVEKSIQGMCILQEVRIIFANRALSEILGYSIEDLLSLSSEEIANLIHPDDRELVLNRHLERLEGKNVPSHYEFRVIRKDGIIRTVDIYATLITFNEKPAVQEVFIDITERKIAEQKLKESQEKYRDMIHNLDLGFYQVKWDGTILNVNPEFRRIIGFGQFEDLSNKNIKDFWRNEEELKKYSEELLRNNVVDNYTGHGKNKYGEELIVQTDSHLIRDENGKPIRVEGTVIDITEKFKLEQKLKESEIRYRSLFEKSPLAIILADSNGIIRDANPSTETLIGYKKAEIIGRAFTNLSLIHPDHLQIIMKRFQQQISGEIEPAFDVQYYHKDGSVLWANIIYTIIGFGEESFVQVIAHDITVRKKAELLIKEEVEKLKELDQMRKDLISRVSHELKTPLIPIMGGAELLLDFYKDKFESEPLEIIEMIEKGGKRLATLVERLLDITKIEYEKFKLEKSRTNLSEIVRAGVRDMKYLIDKRELDLYLVVPDEFYAEIDGFRIEQVVTNLLSNAIKNTPLKGRISLMLEKYGNWAIISVSDTGVGFTEEEIKQLFTRFGKFERYGEGLEYIDMGGSGLGLYISKQIIDLHKGKIWVESTGRNRGCIFKVRIPIV